MERYTTIDIKSNSLLQWEKKNVVVNAMSHLMQIADSNISCYTIHVPIIYIYFFLKKNI